MSVGALARDVKPKTVTKTFTVSSNKSLTNTQVSLKNNLITLRQALAAAPTPEAKANVQAQIDEAISDAQADGLTADQLNTVLADIHTEEAIQSIDVNTVSDFSEAETESLTTYTVTFVDPQSGYKPG